MHSTEVNNLATIVLGADGNARVHTSVLIPVELFDFAKVEKLSFTKVMTVALEREKAKRARGTATNDLPSHDSRATIGTVEL
ncbi:MAG: hypothetical protein PWP08_1284 [Methanofollis sp.]|nr:hypothetical protein [Methanofollis sp.]